VARVVADLVRRSTGRDKKLLALPRNRQVSTIVVSGVTEILTTMCARHCGRRAAAYRTRRAVEAIETGP
jgi:predicted site-specific integrase-resolvase